jgi:glycosyltransferase involved in cell wall biosynthesis
MSPIASRKIRVLHVIPSVSKKHGGPSYAIVLLAKASQQLPIEITVATSDDDGGRARLKVPLGRPIERDGIIHFFFRRDLVPYKISFSLTRWLNHHVGDFDVVHIHALFSFSSLVAARAARKRGVPYVVRPLGVLNRWGLENRRPLLKRLSLRLIELPILRRAAAIHFTSEAERREAVSTSSDVASLQSFVIPIPVETEHGAGSTERFLAEYPQVRGKKVVLFLSRIDQKKGIELLMEAFAVVRRSEPNLLLVIAGNGGSRYIDSLRVQAAELNISSDVLWTGFLGPADKASAYAAASVFVLPSHSENFGIAAAEALAAGVPCVLSDQVALSDYLQNDDSALVVPCESEAIANAIGELLSRPEMRARLASRGRQVAAERFSSQAVGKALLDMYRSMVGARSREQGAGSKRPTLNAQRPTHNEDRTAL